MQANWDKVQTYWNHQCRTKALLREISKGTAVFYTSPVVGSPGYLERDIRKSRGLLHNVAIERARRYEGARMKRLLRHAEIAPRPKKESRWLSQCRSCQRGECFLRAAGSADASD